MDTKTLKRTTSKFLLYLRKLEDQQENLEVLLRIFFKYLNCNSDKYFFQIVSIFYLRIFVITVKIDERASISVPKYWPVWLTSQLRVIKGTLSKQ